MVLDKFNELAEKESVFFAIAYYVFYFVTNTYIAWTMFIITFLLFILFIIILLSNYLYISYKFRETFTYAKHLTYIHFMEYFNFIRYHIIEFKFNLRHYDWKFWLIIALSGIVVGIIVLFVIASLGEISQQSAGLLNQTTQYLNNSIQNATE